MKKDRFLWSAHRITERQKAGKAGSIKGKQLKNSRNTASKPLVARLSSASADTTLYRFAPYASPPVLAGGLFFGKRIFFCRLPIDNFPGK